jgi:hypothetical protein
MNRYLRYAVAAAFAAGSLATSVAHAVVEMEGNDTLGTAQPLTLTNGTVEVTGVLGVTSPDLPVTNDVDFYSFEATEGDVVTIDIDGAMKGMFAGSRAVDTVIAVFSADGAKLRENDDANEIDAGSEATNDSMIVDFAVPATGKYIVGVSSFPRTFQDFGGGLTSTAVDSGTGNGSYTLVLTCVNAAGLPCTPPPVAEQPAPPAEEPPPPVVTPAPPGQTKKVGIDIRPRHSGVTKVYPQADGRISVAILSSSTFDAMKVDKYSLKFGAEGNEPSYVGCWPQGIDVNRDGRKDLVCRFDNRKAGFEVGDLEGVVTGTAEGNQFEGRAPLRVVMKGKKRKHGHDHDRGDNRGHGGWHSNRGRD